MVYWVRNDAKLRIFRSVIKPDLGLLGCTVIDLWQAICLINDPSLASQMCVHRSFQWFNLNSVCSYCGHGKQVVYTQDSSTKGCSSAYWFIYSGGRSDLGFVFRFYKTSGINWVDSAVSKSVEIVFNSRPKKSHYWQSFIILVLQNLGIFRF